MNLICAECGDPVAPDMAHVKVDAERKDPNDRNKQTTYYFHPECWWRGTRDWNDPA